MGKRSRWIDLEGAVNVRDLGGLPTADGETTRFGQVLRSDNLQHLTPMDVAHLVSTIGVRDLVDLRSSTEVTLAGPGPLTAVAGISVHYFSLFTEVAGRGDPKTDLSQALPWRTRGGRRHRPEDVVIGRYLDYFADRPESIVSAVRRVAHGAAATVVTCAAGKDRTGVVCALMLEAVGVTREAVVADYAQTGERIDAILERLRNDKLYAADVEGRPVSAALPRPYFMEKLLTVIEERHGGARSWLKRHGWSDSDQSALLNRLVG